MKTLLTMFVVALCCSSVALGQTQQQATGNETTTIRYSSITLSAEQVVSDSTIGSMKARGNVTADIRNGALKFQADEVEIEIDQKAGVVKVTARGNIRGDISLNGSTQRIETNRALFQIKL